LTIATVLEIVKICFEENLYFDEQHKKMFNLKTVSQNTHVLMEELEKLLSPSKN